MSKHTPGPWHVGGGQYVVKRANGCVIARTNIDHNDENRANARLIAAAPELFGSLCWAVQILDELILDGVDVFSEDRLEEARAAIAKTQQP